MHILFVMLSYPLMVLFCVVVAILSLVTDTDVNFIQTLNTVCHISLFICIFASLFLFSLNHELVHFLFYYFLQSCCSHNILIIYSFYRKINLKHIIINKWGGENCKRK